MDSKSESVIVREICDYLFEAGYFFWRSNNVPVFGRALPKFTPKGLPDIMMVHNGVFVGFEVKRPADESKREKNGRTIRAGTMSVEQMDFGEKLRRAGGEYNVVRSKEEAAMVIDRRFA